MSTFSLLSFTELSDFLHHLDTRADSAIKISDLYLADRKTRTLSLGLDTVPPQGAPTWTVDKDWLKGKASIN